MRLPSLLAARRRPSSRSRPALRLARCHPALEALEDRNAPGSLALDFPNELRTPVIGDLGHDAASDLATPNHPTNPMGVNLDGGEDALRPAELSNHQALQAPHWRVPASDSTSDARPEVVTPGPRSEGSVAALVLASRTSRSAPAPIEGGISTDVDGEATFKPIRQDGCVITFEHPDDHDLTGSVQGRWHEAGLLTLDVCTGQGFFRAEGVFDGTVLGHGPGTATLRVQGEVRESFFIDHGHFVITQGWDGLAGVHARGSFQYTVPHGDTEGGGSYVGLAHFDSRR